MICSRCEFEAEQPVHCNTCGRQFCTYCFAEFGCCDDQVMIASGATDPPLDPQIIYNALPPTSYQKDCIRSVFGNFDEYRSTLAVLATGLGKTVIFGHVASQWRDGRVLVLVHRDELMRQARKKVGLILGEECDVEMGEYYADQCSVYNRSHVVVSSVQTMCQERRMKRFDPSDFGLVIIDEAHHATAKTYRRVIDYFCQNERLKVLGVTATPDRADEEALGKVFESVSFTYDIAEGVSDGWLVPIQQQFVFVDGLDFSQCRTTAGDLNGADLAKVMEAEEMLHKVVDPTVQLAGERKTLVFAASVAHAERMCEICNRHKPGSGEFIFGGMEYEQRRDILGRFDRGEFQFLFNCMIATEGFDQPDIGCVSIARPTKSRALYAQMIGRGTRPTANVYKLTDAAERSHAIATSDKPDVLILDFVGNSGRHKLLCTADILGGNYDDDIVDAATASAQKKSKRGEAVDIQEELKAAVEAREEAAKAKRAALIGKASFGTKAIDPFMLFDVAPKREPGWHKGRKPSEKMAAVLEKRGVDTRNLSWWQCKLLLDGGVMNKPTLKQAKVLTKFGYDPTQYTTKEASGIIDSLAANNWKRPKEPINGI